jgi:hypothetical protein
MSLKLNSVGGGSVTLQEPNTASNLTLDLPATAGTVALTSQLGGGVTSLNGQTGAITDTSTNVIGSYILAWPTANVGTIDYGTTVAGTSINRVVTASFYGGEYTRSSTATISLSGTWRSMACTIYNGSNSMVFLWVRVS